MRFNLSLSQLEAFLRVAEVNSFTAAAKGMHLSQPALSRTIRQAEEAIGAALFDRDTRHVQLTSVGQELLPVARRILGEFDSACSDLARVVAGRHGRVRVAAVASAAAAFLPAAISRFLQMRPRVRFTVLDIASSLIEGAVADGAADVGVALRPQDQEQLTFTSPIRDDFVLVCRADNPLAAQKVVNWSVLEGRPFIAMSYNADVRATTEAVFRELKLAVTPLYECEKISTIAALIAAGLGVSVLPRLTLGLIGNPGIIARPLAPARTRTLGIVTRTGRTLSPAAAEFVQVLSLEIARFADTAPRKPRKKRNSVRILINQ